MAAVASRTVVEKVRGVLESGEIGTGYVESEDFTELVDHPKQEIGKALKELEHEYDTLELYKHRPHSADLYYWVVDS